MMSTSPPQSPRAVPLASKLQTRVLSARRLSTRTCTHPQAYDVGKMCHRDERDSLAIPAGTDGIYHNGTGPHVCETPVNEVCPAEALWRQVRNRPNLPRRARQLVRAEPEIAQVDLGTALVEHKVLRLNVSAQRLSRNNMFVKAPSR